MAKQKKERESIFIDMTAMSDMAWLLLTFFILTTQFRKPEVVPVKTPSSVSTTKAQDGDLIQITINKDGNYYFSIIDDRNKLPVLEKMGQKHGITFTDDEKLAFMGLAEVTVPISQLKQYLSLDKSAQMEERNLPGVPLDSLNLQLMEWVDYSYEVDGDIKIAIKGDVSTQYPKFKSLIDNMLDKKYNKFQLITSTETKPQ